MDAYDSDSSLDDVSGTTTDVLLGYASKEATDDAISHLGGLPSWLSPEERPSAALAQCKSCSKYMNLLLELHGDMPDKFPGHERRLYIWTCRRKACRRKPGSLRAIRGVRAIAVEESKTKAQAPKNDPVLGQAQGPAQTQAPRQGLGAALFGGTSTANAASSNPNPFSTTASSSTSQKSNPFSTTLAPLSSLASKPSQKPMSSPDSDVSALPATFAQKASLNTAPTPQPDPPTPWPALSAFPPPFPYFHLDADYEYLSPTSTSKAGPSLAQSSLMDTDPPESGASNDKDAALAESAHDKTFQAFADRIAQNPEQVLRYALAGPPLLCSRSDDVARLLLPDLASASAPSAARIPPCARCGARRLFELQLMPGAIAELEADMDAAQAFSEGMEWATVVVAVCEADCALAEGGGVGYAEEWCGVQWEEVVSRK